MIPGRARCGVAGRWYDSFGCKRTLRYMCRAFPLSRFNLESLCSVVSQWPCSDGGILPTAPTALVCASACAKWCRSLPAAALLPRWHHTDLLLPGACRRWLLTRQWYGSSSMMWEAWLQLPRAHLPPFVMMGLSSPGVIRRVAEIVLLSKPNWREWRRFTARILHSLPLCWMGPWLLGETPSNGGDSSMVQDRLQGIVNVQGNPYAFAAVTEEGSLVTWGKAPWGAIVLWYEKVRQVTPSLKGFFANADGCQVHTWVCQSVCSSALQWIHCYMGSAGRRRGQLRSAICVCHFLVAVAINVATAAAAKLDIFTNLDIWYRQTGLRNSLLWCKNLRWEAGRNGNLVVEIVGTSSQSLRCTVRCSCPACSENFMLFNYSVV